MTQATAKALQYVQELDMQFDGKSVIVVAGRDGEELWADNAPEFTVDQLGRECVVSCIMRSCISTPCLLGLGW